MLKNSLRSICCPLLRSYLSFSHNVVRMMAVQTTANRGNSNANDQLIM